MKRSIAELKNRHADETIWLIASGASLDFVAPSFFNDKTTVVVNEAIRDFHTSYAFAHHREPAQEAMHRGFVTVASEYNRCDRSDGLNELQGEWYMYRHPQQPSTLMMDMRPLEQNLDDTLVVGSNTVTSAMDFAGRILGAATIILCGVDSGSLDQRWNYQRYNTGCTTPRYDSGKPCGTINGTGLPHIRAQVALIATVTAALRKLGINIYSLNPFVDLALEGHVYAR